MDFTLLDECLIHLMEADEALSKYNEIDAFSEIFEADNSDEVRNKLMENHAVELNSKSGLEKACDALINFIKGIINSIKDFFEKAKLSEKERQAYDAFKAAAAKDPNLKNKRITVADFKKLDAGYQELLNEAKAIDNDLVKGNDKDVNPILKKITDYCDDLGKGIVTSIGIEAALNVASSSTEIARKMSKELTDDSAIMQNIRASIGDKQAAKFKRQMDSLGKRISLQRGIMRLKGTYSKSVQDGISKTYQNIMDAVGAAQDIAKVGGPKTGADKNIVQNAAETVKYAVKNRKEVAKAGKAAVKNSGIISRLSGNETIKKGVGKAVDIVNDSNKQARELYKQENPGPLKRVFNKPKTHNQTAMQAIMGVNDENSFMNKRKK